MPKRSIGENIRKFRLDAGLSLNDIENTCGVSKARLSRYENGHVVPTVRTIELIAEAIGVRPAFLVGWE